ncbi:hypothetical protein [Cellulomonas aerilata]|uniref:Htaa domain-containing protein n=1 Tax=Cellulomonas aerilata TaxID=515326 RepID=A0A512DEQ0_9CELL|nr:hypothetical protein [Cellulomonas aerilata]GEO34949.1 hypothetical protein CAE01nite_26740 [Cellulomonas aerilata]
MRKSPWIAAVTAVLAAGGTASAHAAPSRWEITSGTEEFSFEICGRDWTAVSTFTERLKWRQPREAGAPRLQVAAYQYRVEFTADGVTLTTEGHGLFKDRRATHVEGTVWQFDVADLGVPYSLYDPDGRLLVRDRGVATSSFRVDTQGDVDLDNDVLVDEGPVLVEAGEFPSLTFDFCALIAPYFDA